MTPEQLNQFEPFHDLDEKSKLIAAKLIAAKTIKKGTSLFEVGDSDETEFFLCSGEVELVAVDGIKKTIVAGDPAAYFPLALLRPRKFSATVASDTAKLIHLPVAVLRQLRKDIPVVGDAVSAFSPLSDEISFSSIESTDVETIKNLVISAKQAIVDNRVVVVNFDDVSTTILNVVQDSSASLDMIISAAQLDAGISAKLIKSANSAFYGGLAKVDSVRAAVVRLGQDLSIQLITVMIMKEVFNSDNDALQNAMRRIWQSSLKLATFCVVIGKRSSLNVQQGQSLLAGLMNEIGYLVIISYLDQFPGVVSNISEHVLNSEKIKVKLGAALLEHWDFPQAIINVVEQSGEFDREVEKADLCDVVSIAKLLIRMTSYRKIPVVEITEISSYSRLGFDKNNSTLINEILEEAHNYMQLFSGAFEN